MRRRAARTQLGRIERVIEHIDRHLDDDLSLAALSRIAGVSPFYFLRSFSSIAGVPPARRAQLLRLKRASMRLAFMPARSITDVAFEAGFENAESLSRAFKRVFSQSPREFRRAPRWDIWRATYRFQQREEPRRVDVRIVDFPETPVAALEHRGSPHREYDTSRRFIEWRLANRLSPDRHRTYGIHYNDPRTTADADYRMDICVSVDRPIAPNPQGVVNKVIPGGRCAVARHIGPREHIPAAVYVYDVWLPASGEALRDFPIFFHYVNVGPTVQDHEMVTDVYLPLR